MQGLGYCNDRNDADNEIDHNLVEASVEADMLIDTKVAEHENEQKSTTIVKDDASKKVSNKQTSYVQTTFHKIKEPENDRCFRVIPVKIRVYDKDNKVETKTEWKHYCTICSRSFKLMDSYKKNRHCESRPHNDNVARHLQRMRMKTEGVTNKQLMNQMLTLKLQQKRQTRKSRQEIRDFRRQVIFELTKKRDAHASS